MPACLRLFLTALLGCVTSLSVRAADGTVTIENRDAALHQTVVGTWLSAQDAGVASVAMYTTYREDGIAIQLIKTKFIFQKAKGVWIENRWSIRNGELHLTPLRFRASSDDAKVDQEEAVRRSLSVDAHEMAYELKGKERKERRSSLPGDVQQMLVELAPK